MGKRLVTCLFMSMLFSSVSFALPSLNINQTEGSYTLGPYIEIFEDPSGQLNIDQVISPQNNALFHPLHSDTPNLGFSKSAFWMRVLIKNSAAEPQSMILQQFSAWIDYMALYVIHENGVMERTLAGEKYPFYQREIVNPRFLFNIEMMPGEQAWIYFQAKSDDPLQLPLTLWHKKTFENYNLGMTQYFGVVFGCLLTIFFYNLFLFFSLRDKNYLLYVLYIASLLFMIFNYTGNSYQYFWPDNPRFQDWVVFPSGFLAMFLAVFFTKGFLETRVNLPGAHRFLTMFQVFLFMAPVVGTATGGGFFTSFSTVAAAMVFPFIQAFIGVMAFRKNIRAARYFIIAWASSMIGIFYTMITVMGLLPSSSISRHSMEVGLVIDAILLSFALADKIKILSSEKEELERQSMELLAASKDELEARVMERTAELKQAKEKAEEANHMKEKFVSLVSHDLRAPLGAIIGLVRSALEKDQTEKDKQDEYMRRSIKAAERLLSMIDHLLNITRLRSGKIAPIKTVFSARDLASEVMASLDQLAVEKWIKMENNIPSDYMLVADRSLAARVFSNILANSIKFCENAGWVAVSVDEQEPDSIIFMDNGVGIKEEFLPDLFSAEVRTTSVGVNGERGAGLGLPYCHEIMQAHGGAISAQRGKRGGSLFKITFPRAQRLVLLVDDQEAQRGMMKEAISNAIRVDFLETDDGAEALRMLGFAKPCIIISDIAMPKMNGISFLEKVKSDERLRSIPVVIASAGTGSDMEDADLQGRVKHLGAADYVSKPISLVDFAQMTLRLIDHS